jgi:hypothetical protein
MSMINTQLFRETCLQRINFSDWSQTVATWRTFAKRIGLDAIRINWGGPIEVVAWRVLEEARKRGLSEEQVLAQLTEMLASPIPVAPASVDNAAAAVLAMLKLGEAAQIVLLAQANVMGDLPRSTVFDQIETAIATLQNAVAVLREVG